jgi:hypothetical protein
MTAKNDRRKQLARQTKAALIAMCTEGVPNPRGGTTRVWGAHPLQEWTKDEIVATILDIEYPPPVTMDQLTFEGLE